MKSMKWLLILVFTFFVSIILADTLPFSDLGSQETKIISVEVTDNPELPLILKKKKSYVITIKFECLADIYDADVYTQFVIQGIAMPATIGKIESISYPLQKGKVYTAKFTLPISSSYPTVSGNLNLYLRNKKNGKDIIYFCLAVRID